MQLTPRQRRILAELIQHTGPVTGDQLAVRLGVTARTVRKDIRQLAALLARTGVQITSVPGLGYELDPTSRRDAEELVGAVEADGYRSPVRPEGRTSEILSILLMAEGPLTVEELADSLFVSRSTLTRDLEQVESWLGENGLRLIKKPSVGLEIEGEELARRTAVVSLLLAKAPLQQSGFDVLQDELGSTASVLRDILRRMRKEGSLLLSDTGYLHLLGYLAVSMQRIWAGKFTSQQDPSLQQTPVYRKAAQITAGLEEAFMVSFPASETASLALVLRQADPFPTPDLSQESSGSSVHMLVEGFFSWLSFRFGVNFSGDNDLLVSLSLYVEMLLHRDRTVGIRREGSLRAIGKEYPTALEMAVETAEWFSGEIDIPQEAFHLYDLALYFAAALERRKIMAEGAANSVALICSTGTAGAQLLRAKFERQFPGIRIQGVYPSYRLREALRAKPDFVVSTVPLDGGNVPVLVVHQLLTEGDTRSIRKFLNRGSLPDGLDSRAAFLELFQEDAFRNDMDCDHREDVIQILGNILEAQGTASPGFTGSVLERESKYSTAIGNCVAIPHALSPGGSGSRVAVGILQKPIPWGEERVQLVLLLHIKQQQHDAIKSIFDMLYDLLSDEKTVRLLCKAGSFRDFKEILSIRLTGTVNA